MCAMRSYLNGFVHMYSGRCTYSAYTICITIVINQRDALDSVIMRVAGALQLTALAYVSSFYDACYGGGPDIPHQIESRIVVHTRPYTSPLSTDASFSHDPCSRWPDFACRHGGPGAREGHICQGGAVPRSAPLQIRRREGHQEPHRLQVDIQFLS